MNAMAITDVVNDTVHQFAPQYNDYVLYSDGSTTAGSSGVISLHTGHRMEFN